LHISAAAHSPLVEPALATFARVVASVRLAPPSIPWISDTTGRPVRPDEATDPAYWTAHMRRTVDFASVLDTVLADRAALLEVGPGRTLGGLARQHPAYTDDRPVVASMPHAADQVGGTAVLLTAAGRLWQAGVPLDWAALHADQRPHRVPLPAYPFQRRRFLLDETGAPGIDAGTDTVADTSASIPALAPSDTEVVVAAAYRAILGVDPVDRYRDFFELGGDSLLAARVAGFLRRELGGDIGVRVVFGAPTVAGLAAAIDERRTVGT
jgi:acyl transferase domain-containing protein